MNKTRLLLLTLPLLLISCGGSQNTGLSNISSSGSSITNESSAPLTDNSLLSSNAPITLDEDIFLQFKNGLKLQTTAKEQHNNDTKEIYLKTSMKDKEVSLIEYSDNLLTDIKIHETYLGLPDDNLVYSTRLGVSNKVIYYKTLNTATGEYFTWDDGYTNPFSSLSFDDFLYSNEKYTLKDDMLTATIKDSLSTLFYGNPGIEIQSLALYVNDQNEITFESTGSFGTSYAYEFTSTVLSYGEKVEIDYRAKPFDEVEDKTFTDLIASLKQNNYIAKVSNFIGDNEDTSYYFRSNKDKVSFSVQEYEYGFYEENGMIQEVQKKEDGYHKIGSSEEGTLLDLKIFPSFDLSRACFDLESDSTYRMKNGVEGDISCITNLMTETDELVDFKIQINQDSTIFTNVHGRNKTVVEITDIGNADVGFTLDTLIEDEKTATWDSILAPEDITFINQTIGEGNLALIPVPSAYQTDTWVQFSEEAGYAILIAEGKATLDEDLLTYGRELEEAGFIYYEEELGPNGGALYIIEATYENASHVLGVEILNSEGIFTIVLYIAE